MSKKYFVELCAHCEEIDPKNKVIYEKVSGICPKCQSNSWIILEIDPKNLMKKYIKKD